MTRARDVANIDGLLTTTGDTYYASAAGTPARLGVGTTGQVMTVAAGLPSWATAATPASGLTLINSGTFASVASVSLPTSSFTSTYTSYRVYIEFTSANANAAVTVRKRASGTDVTTSNYGTGGVKCKESGALEQIQGANLSSWKTGIDVNIGTGYFLVIEVSSPAIANQSYKGLSATGNINTGGGGTLLGWTFNGSTNYDSLTFIMASGTFNGLYRVYGYQD
jgi:hypothetical protein